MRWRERDREDRLMEGGQRRTCKRGEIEEGGGEEGEEKRKGKGKGRGRHGKRRRGKA